MMKFLATLFMLLVSLGSVEATVQQTTQANPSPTIQTQSSPVIKEGSEGKTDESKDYREMFDKLLDRATWFFGVIWAIVVLLGGVIIWLVKWTLKETREDAKKELQKEMKQRGLGDLETLQHQIASLDAFKDRRVDWIRPESVAEPTKELAFLKRAGLTHVSPIPVADEETALMLNDPDLVILSFDGSQKSKDLLKLIVGLLKRSQKEVPVLVYAPLGLRIDPPEMKLLDETALHASANFPATLVTQALELVRLRQS